MFKNKNLKRFISIVCITLTQQHIDPILQNSKLQAINFTVENDEEEEYLTVTLNERLHSLIVQPDRIAPPEENKQDNNTRLLLGARILQKYQQAKRTTTGNTELAAQLNKMISQGKPGDLVILNLELINLNSCTIPDLPYTQLRLPTKLMKTLTNETLEKLTTRYPSLQINQDGHRYIPIVVCQMSDRTDHLDRKVLWSLEKNGIVHANPVQLQHMVPKQLITVEQLKKWLAERRPDYWAPYAVQKTEANNNADHNLQVAKEKTIPTPQIEAPPPIAPENVPPLTTQNLPTTSMINGHDKPDQDLDIARIMESNIEYVSSRSDQPTVRTNRIPEKTNIPQVEQHRKTSERIPEVMRSPVKKPKLTSTQKAISQISQSNNPDIDLHVPAPPTAHKDKLPTPITAQTLPTTSRIDGQAEPDKNLDITRIMESSLEDIPSRSNQPSPMTNVPLVKTTPVTPRPNYTTSETLPGIKKWNEQPDRLRYPEPANAGGPLENAKNLIRQHPKTSLAVGAMLTGMFVDLVYKFTKLFSRKQQPARHRHELKNNYQIRVN